MPPLRRKILYLAWQDFRRTWPQLVLSDFLARAFAAMICMPIISLMLKLFLTQTEDGILQDEEILQFLLHPIGLIAGVLVGAVSLVALFATQGLQMVILFGATENRLITYLGAARYLAKYLWQWFCAASQVLIRILPLIAVCLAGLYALYRLFLSDYDINYYLTVQPVEFWEALGVAALLLTLFLLAVMRKMAGWILVLPLILLGGESGNRSLRTSKQLVSPMVWKITGLLFFWLLMICLVSFLAALIFSFVGNLLVPQVGASLVVLAVGLITALILTGLGQILLTAFTTAFFSAVIVRLYCSLSKKAQLSPPLAKVGTLGQSAGLRLPGKRFLCVGVGLLIGIGAGAYFSAEQMMDGAKTEIIAHRGASAVAPENTLSAFKKAIAEGADWIELDVQENADGVVVVAHDNDFMKVARRNLKVWDATNEQLKDLDIGSWFGQEFSDQRVPTLKQALELAKGHLGVMIELKYYGHDDRLESRVVDLVEQMGMANNIQIMSLKLAGLRKAMKMRPQWKYGLLNAASIGDLTQLDVNFLALNAKAASRTMIARAHAQGMKVYVWTVNDPMQMWVLISRGADGIITDDPAMMHKVMEVRQQFGAIGRLLLTITIERGWLKRPQNNSSASDV